MSSGHQRALRSNGHGDQFPLPMLPQDKRAIALLFNFKWEAVNCFCVMASFPLSVYSQLRDYGLWRLRDLGDARGLSGRLARMFARSSSAGQGRCTPRIVKENHL